MSILTAIFGFIKPQTTDNIGQMINTDAHTNWDKVETELSARPKTEGTDYCGIDPNNVGKIKPERASAPIIEVTDSTTLALSHAGAQVRVNSTSNKIITIPTNASVAFPVGTEIEILRYNTGTVTIAGDTGVTLLAYETARTVATRYKSVCAKKMDTDAWLLQGALG